MYRTFAARARVQRYRSAVVVLQAALRRTLAQRVARRRLAALLVIQRYVRAWRFRQQQRRQHRAVVRIQSAYRGHRVRVRVQRALATVVRMQAVMRGALVRHRAARRTARALVVQSAVRMWRARLQWRRMSAAAVLLQRVWRRYASNVQWQRVQRATLRLQSWARGMLVRRSDVRAKHRAAMVIQRAWKRHVTRRSVTRLRWAVAVLHRMARRYHSRKQYVLPDPRPWLRWAFVCALSSATRMGSCVMVVLTLRERGPSCVSVCVLQRAGACRASAAANRVGPWPGAAAAVCALAACRDGVAGPLPAAARTAAVPAAATRRGGHPAMGPGPSVQGGVPSPGGRCRCASGTLRGWVGLG